MDALEKLLLQKLFLTIFKRNYTSVGCNSCWHYFHVNMLHTVLLQALLFWLSGVATILTSSLGVVGNLLSLAVLSKKVGSNRRSGRRRARQNVNMSLWILSSSYQNSFTRPSIEYSRLGLSILHKENIRIPKTNNI